jgi:multiple sugar transport system substrate-binding protein
MNDQNTRPNREQGLENGLTRRQFIKTASWATGAALTAGTLLTVIPGIAAPAILKGTKLHLLQWINFVPPADDETRRQAEEWGKGTGAQVTIEAINASNLQARIEAALASGAGPDIIEMFYSWPHVYADGCIDIDDVAQKVEQNYGGYYEQIRGACMVQDHYKAVPHEISAFVMTYREDWFKEVGAEQFPETWEELRKFGKLLKDKGHPLGHSLGHSWGDPASFAYSYLWSFGGKEVEADSKTVALESPETLQAVGFMVPLWKEAFEETGLYWNDDTSNNRAFLTQQISCTFNPASIYFVAKQHNPDLAQRINHTAMPTGPAGRFHYNQPHELAVMKYSHNIEAAKEFILFLMEKPNYYKRLELSAGNVIGMGPDQETHPMWHKDPRLLAVKDVGRLGRNIGYPAPPSRSAVEAVSKHIIVDVFARAVQGEPPQKAIAWGANELRKIYQS